MPVRVKWIHNRCAPQDTILDVGGNTGWVWEGSGLHNIVIFDINEFASHFPQVVGDAHNLPFQDESFAIVCLCELLEHVVSPSIVLKEAARVARKKVIFTVPNEYEWPAEFKPCQPPGAKATEDGLTPKEEFMLGNPTCTKINDLSQAEHRRWFTRETLTERIEQLGLPYYTDELKYGGWAFFVGEIFKRG